MACVECLRGDPVPYFRTHWRLGCFVDCDVHGCKLVDCCPYCRYPLWPSGVGVLQNLHPGFTSFNFCWHCGIDMSAPSLAMPFVNISGVFKDWLQSGQATFATACFFAGDGLDALRGLCHLFLRRRSRDVMVSTGREGAKIANQLSFRARDAQSIEHLNVQDRSVLLPPALRLLHDWPDSFIDFAAENNISRTHFCGVQHMQPSWMNECIDRHLSRQNRAITPQIVSHTIKTWIAEKGSMPTKTAVRGLLKWQGERLLNAYYPKREKASDVELQIFVQAVDLMRIETQMRTQSRCAFLLDFYILVVALVSRQKISTVINMPKSDLELIVEKSRSQLYFTAPWNDLITASVEHIRANPSGCAKDRQVKKRLVKLMKSLPDDLIREIHVFRSACITMNE